MNKSASRVSVELNYHIIFVSSGNSYDPQLEDVDITVPRLLDANCIVADSERYDKLKQ